MGLRPRAAMASIDIGFATSDVVRVGKTRCATRTSSQVEHVPLAGRLVWKPVVVARLAALTEHVEQAEVEPA